MVTGKAYEEVYKPAVKCDAGKWTGTRIFRVTTSSPSVAILTIHQDADIPPGTEWDEDCDPDYAAATTTAIKMKSKTYDTAPLGSDNVLVTVGYEDSRYNVEFDETTLGFVRKYWKFGLASDTIYRGIDAVLAYDSTALSIDDAYQPTITVGTTDVPDLRIGWDGETLAGAPTDYPTLVYGEVWRLNVDASGVYGSSLYVPGIETIVDYSDRLSNQQTYNLAKRVGQQWSTGDALNLDFMQALMGFTGTVNSAAYRNFPIRSLRMDAPQIQQVGIEAYICNFEWTFHPPYYYDLDSSLEEPEIYIGESQLETLEKAGWDYLWFLYKSGTDKGEVEEIRVAQIKTELDFAALGLER